MSIATMMRIVWWIAVAALTVTLLASVLAVAAPAPVEGEDPYRSHILFSLAAVIFVAPAHLFFVFFLVSARQVLRRETELDRADLRALIVGAGLALGAVGLAGAALATGVAALTTSGREAAHQWTAWLAVSAQFLALFAENRASRVVWTAESASRLKAGS